MSLVCRVLCRCVEGVADGAPNVSGMDDVESRPYAVSDKWTEVSDLRFSGKRFDEHTIDLEVAEELVQFQRLVTELASDLYRKATRRKLPENFAASTALRFTAINGGSSTLPLQAPIVASESLFGSMPSPYVEQAIDLIYKTIKSQEEGREIPDGFPRGTMVKQLSRWGGTLKSDESISVRDVSTSTTTANTEDPPRARFSRETRDRLTRYIDDTYSEVVRLYGEIRSIDLDKCFSLIRLPNESRIEVRFDSDLLPRFQSALKGEPVAVTGLAKISRKDGYVQQITSVTDIVSTGHNRTSESLASYLSEVAEKADWSRVPTDYSMRMDEYLYGEGRR